MCYASNVYGTESGCEITGFSGHPKTLSESHLLQGIPTGKPIAHNQGLAKLDSWFPFGKA